MEFFLRFKNVILSAGKLTVSLFDVLIYFDHYILINILILIINKMHAQWRTVLHALYLHRQPNCLLTIAMVCVCLCTKSILFAQPNTNLPVGKEETENEKNKK